MSRSESGTRIVAVCRSCESVFVSEQKPDGTIRPIGVSEECTCGNGDFRRVDPPEDGASSDESTSSDDSTPSDESATAVPPLSD